MIRRLITLGAACALAGGMVVLGAPAMAGASSDSATCSGPTGPGHFERLVVPPGAHCQINGRVSVDAPLRIGAGALVFVSPTAQLRVDGSLTLERGAVLAAPQNTSPIDVDGSVHVRSGAVLLIGTETPGGPLVNRIDGPVLGDDATGVQIHNASIDGPVSLRGGGADNPAADQAAGNQPVNFNDLEDNHIDGPVSVRGYAGIWAGVIRNHIDGNLTFTNNTDKDEFDIGSNVVDGNARCTGNNPAVNTGGSPGSPNTVEGHNTCG